jgi:hypothetical protein
MYGMGLIDRNSRAGPLPCCMGQPLAQTARPLAWPVPPASCQVDARHRRHVEALPGGRAHAARAHAAPQVSFKGDGCLGGVFAIADTKVGRQALTAQESVVK